MILAFGPLISYFLLVLYTALMASTLGYDWVQAEDNMLAEYVVILQLYYITYILLAVGPKRHSGKQK